MKFIARDALVEESLTTRRTYAPVELASSVEELRGTKPSPRTLAFIASTDETNRYGDRITVDGKLGSRVFGKGWKLDSFKRNPVFMAFHSYDTLPLGTVTRVWKDLHNPHKKMLKIAVEFAPPQVNPLAETFLSAYRGKTLRGVSVGFQPIKSYSPRRDAERLRLRLGKSGVVYGEQEMWEVSAVSIPANPSSLMEGICADEKCRLIKFGDRVADIDGELGYRMRSALGLKPKRKTFDFFGVDVAASLRRRQMDEAGDRLEASLRRLIQATERAAHDSQMRLRG